MEFTILGNQYVSDDQRIEEVNPVTFIANMVDVECASINTKESGLELLTVRLNEYAENMVVDRIGNDKLQANACVEGLPLSSIEAERDASGRTLFVFGLSQDRKTSEKQRQCITSQISLKSTCVSQ